MDTRRLLAKLGWHLRERWGPGAKLAKNEILQKARRLGAKRNQERGRLREEWPQAISTVHSPSSYGRGIPVFFIVGRGRSGTTWLRSILNSHPEILCWGEGRFFERSFKREDFE